MSVAVALDVGRERGSRRSRSGLKRRLVSVGFILTGFGPEWGRGDLFRDSDYGLWIDRFAWRR